MRIAKVALESTTTWGGAKSGVGAEVVEVKAVAGSEERVSATVA